MSVKDVFFSYCDAIVNGITDDVTTWTCTVSFEKYGNTEIVKVRQCYLCNILKLFIQGGHVKQPKYDLVLFGHCAKNGGG